MCGVVKAKEDDRFQMLKDDTRSELAPLDITYSFTLIMD